MLISIPKQGNVDFMPRCKLGDVDFTSKTGKY